MSGLVLGATFAVPLVAAAQPAPIDTGVADHHECPVPVAGRPAATAQPGEVGVDADLLAEAIEFASTRMRTNVQVYRHNCLIGTGPINDVTDAVRWNLFSGTKSVVSMLAGVAYSQGLLDLDAPIGTYLPPGLGDDEHRSIGVRDLLTQTSGLRQSIVSEAATAGLNLDPDIVRQALGLPVDHAPGTYFEYTQRGPDLLASVVEHAVGEDLQAFAQESLFGPLGIGEDAYYWDRDRSGNTYGYAFLFMQPVDFARLGLLMLNDGQWHGRQIIAEDYVRQARTPSTTNACYGFLFWTNAAPCIGPSFPSRAVLDSAPMSGMPDDAYAMTGFLQQNNFIVPSLGLLVTWTGVLGDVSADPATALSASTNSELYHEFFRRLAAAFTDPALPDPGPYQPSYNLEFDPMQVIDPQILLSGVGIGPHATAGCDVVACGDDPLRAPLAGNPGCFALLCLGPVDARHGG